MPGLLGKSKCNWIVLCTPEQGRPPQLRPQREAVRIPGLALGRALGWLLFLGEELQPPAPSGRGALLLSFLPSDGMVPCYGCAKNWNDVWYEFEPITTIACAARTLAGEKRCQIQSENHLETYIGWASSSELRVSLEIFFEQTALKIHSPLFIDQLPKTHPWRSLLYYKISVRPLFEPS